MLRSLATPRDVWWTSGSVPDARSESDSVIVCNPQLALSRCAGTAELPRDTGKSAAKSEDGVAIAAPRGIKLCDMGDRDRRGRD